MLFSPFNIHNACLVYRLNPSNIPLDIQPHSVSDGDRDFTAGCSRILNEASYGFVNWDGSLCCQLSTDYFRYFHWTGRQLHSLSLVAVWLLLRYEILAGVLTCVIAWSEYRLRNAYRSSGFWVSCNSCGLLYPEGIHTIFQMPFI